MMSPKVEVIHYQSVEELKKIVLNKRGDFKLGAIVFLSGEMGTGKTTLVQQVASLFEKASFVQSPTFSFHHCYEGAPTIHHWDLYRIQSMDDLESAGFWEVLNDSRSLIFIEWPQLIDKKWLPTGRSFIDIKFTKNKDESRSLSYFSDIL